MCVAAFQLQLFNIGEGGMAFWTTHTVASRMRLVAHVLCAPLGTSCISAPVHEESRGGGGPKHSVMHPTTPPVLPLDCLLHVSLVGGGCPDSSNMHRH